MSYELLPQLDIIAICTIATEIFHCTSAWLDPTNVNAKIAIGKLPLVSAMIIVVASTINCHAECCRNTPHLPQLRTPLMRWAIATQV